MKNEWCVMIKQGDAWQVAGEIKQLVFRSKEAAENYAKVVSFEQKVECRVVPHIVCKF